jgi:hypothetical protein
MPQDTFWTLIRAAADGHGAEREAVETMATRARDPAALRHAGSLRTIVG